MAAAIGASRFQILERKSMLAAGDRSPGTVPISRPDSCGRPSEDFFDIRRLDRMLSV